LPEFIFTRLGSGFGPLIASYVIGQIIAVERHFYQYVQDQAAKKWIWVECEYGRYRRLSDLSVGILGVGAIGEEVAKVCKSLGMRVCGLVRRNVPIAERCPFVDEYFLMDSLPDLLHQCDYICNVLPSTEATRNLLSGDTLKNCKAKARFINVGRGDIIDDDSLINALRQGWLDHAVLDVCNTEPLPTDSPLWESPKVTVTPHVSGLVDPVLVEERYLSS
jgi:phosphoglycerate dehydrogenase-like enzyme